LKAEIFAVGTELLMGELSDTNAAWIASRLPALGIELQWVTLIGDSLEQLTDAFTRGLQRSDLIVTTGGLGPTQDDLTREGIANALQETPVVQDEVVRELERYFQRRGQTMPSRNIKQAHLIPSAQFLPNPNGTAPGWWVERDHRVIVALPGPPVEMHHIWEQQVEPRLRLLVEHEVTVTRNIKTMGLSEAAVDEVMDEYFGHENPYLGIYSKADGIHLRVIARAHDVATARQLIEPVEAAITDRLAPYIWGYDNETPEQAVGELLQTMGLTLATMESCTGGFLANSITEVPAYTTYYKGGIVANGKAMLIAQGVPAATVEQHGVVSQETAAAMARAVRQSLNADIGIGLSGVPGPSEFEGKPMGLAYVAVATATDLVQRELRVPPRRITIKRRVSNTALIELRKLLSARNLASSGGLQGGPLCQSRVPENDRMPR
jgi:nicotinamide-nucleotide amidase